MSQADSQDWDRKFVDKNRPVMDKYYDLLEMHSHTDEDVYQLIDQDPNFLDTYLYLAHLYRDEDDNEEDARELEDEAFQRALKLITGKNGQWPDQLSWLNFENRHIMSSLAIGANNLWRDGETEKALDIYRKLLSADLRDSIGARYAIIALRMGLSYQEYISDVWPKGGVLAQKLMAWFNQHAPKYSEELQEWKAHAIKESGLEEGDFPF